MDEQRDDVIRRCRHCGKAGPRETWTTYHGLLACPQCLHGSCIVDILESLPARAETDQR